MHNRQHQLRLHQSPLAPQGLASPTDYSLHPRRRRLVLHPRFRSGRPPPVRIWTSQRSVALRCFYAAALARHGMYASLGGLND